MVHIPKTKQSAVSLEAMAELQPQKGQTCWYYSFNLMRLRYKQVDTLVDFVKTLGMESKLKDDKDYLELQRARAIEKSISAYRKFVTTYESEFNRYHVLLKKQENKDAITKKEAEELERIDVQFREKRIALLQDLRRQHVFDEKMHKELINICEKTQNETSLHNFMIYIAGLAYDFKLSKWEPEKGFDALENELIMNGPLHVCGNFGESQYRSEPIKSTEKIADRDVYFFQPGNREDKRTGHAVAVTGVATLETKESKKQEVVYYIDPNRPNDIFRTSYRRFSATIYCTETRARLLRKTGPSRYALHLKDEAVKAHHLRYQRILSQLFPKILDVDFWHDKVSIFSSWGKDGCLYRKEASGKTTQITLPKGIQKIILEIKTHFADEKKADAQKVITNIKEVAKKRLEQPSLLRSATTTLFYRAVSQLDINNARQILDDLSTSKDTLKNIQSAP